MTCLHSEKCEGCGREICLADDIGGHDDYLTVCVRPGKDAIYCGRCNKEEFDAVVEAAYEWRFKTLECKRLYDAGPAEWGEAMAAQMEAEQILFAALAALDGEL